MTDGPPQAAPPSPRRLRGLGPYLLLAVPLFFLAFFFAHPLVTVLRLGATADAWAWLFDDYVQQRLRGAFVQATASTLLTLALAIPLAWHHHRRALPWSRVHLAVHAAPFVLPVFVVAFGIRGLLGTGGLSERLLGLDVLGWLGPLGAVVLAHAYYNYGFAARLLHAALDERPARLEEAAQVLGASPRRALLRVTAALLWPRLAAVALLVWMFSFSSFGVVLILGGKGVATLETLMYSQWAGIRPRYDHIAVLAIAQLAINVAVLGAYLAMRRRANVERDVRPRRLPARPRDRVLQALALVAGLAPAISVLLGSFQVRGTWTLEPWRALFDADHPAHLPGFDLWVALDLSLFYAGWTVALSLGLTLLLAYGLRGVGTWPRRLVEGAATLPLGTSSLLLGFGYILAFGAGAALDLRGTKFLIVLAHTLVAFPFTARALLPAIESLDRRLEGAAALLGAPPWGVWWRVHVPLLRGPLLVAASFAIAMSLGDFGASLLLMRSENMGLSVWIEQHRGRPFDLLVQAQASALTVILMVFAALAYVGVERSRREMP